MSLVMRVRSVLLCVWPFIACGAVVAILVACGTVVMAALDRDYEQEQRDKDLKALVRQNREISVANRRLIERGNPCIEGDDPNSPACVAKRESDARLAAALGVVQEQHNEQARQLADAVARLVELQERVHGAGG